MTKVKSATLADYGATVLRISLGIMYLAHAYLKIAVFTPAGTAQFFESVGFPGWAAYCVIGAEMTAGILLISGWHARWVALAMIPILIGAAATHWGNGWVFTAAGGGWEYPVFLIAASLVQGLLGNGAFAIRGSKFTRQFYIRNFARETSNV
jgi:putative oxidoreductase